LRGIRAGHCQTLLEVNLHGRLIASTYTYDAKGNLVTHTDALGNVVRMVCDLRRTIRVDWPERGSIAVHDAAG
jgi:YD repeat-containing protein